MSDPKLQNGILTVKASYCDRGGNPHRDLPLSAANVSGGSFSSF
jgi:hypothetical protein